MFGYSSYEYPADIYESFPQEAVVEYYEYQAEFYYETELPDDFSVPALPAERVKGETGYKVWESAYGGLCIDVIDLNPSNADLRLDKLYPEILLAAGYTYDEEYECYIYVVEEGVWEIDVYINETDGGYFTAKFSDWYN